MCVGELEDNGFFGDRVITDGVLGNDLIFVFDFDRHRVVGQHGFAFFKDARHFSGFDAVIVIFADPDLELAGLDFALRSTAIEKSFMYVTDLGDVEGERDGITFGKTDAEMAIRILGEQGFQFVEQHGDLASLMGPGQQLFSRSVRRAFAFFRSVLCSGLLGRDSMIWVSREK